jgi:hypothetical protein
MDVSTNHGSPDETQFLRRTWIFQANPRKYRIFESLATEQEECWNLNQHAQDVREGDRVLIWIAGENAGVYAVGTVTTAPTMVPDSPIGQAYWLIPEEGRRVKPRVRVKYEQVLLDRPLRKDYLLADPALCDLGILRFPRRTNFAVSDEEWHALQAWLDDSTA